MGRLQGWLAVAQDVVGCPLIAGVVVQSPAPPCQSVLKQDTELRVDHVRQLSILYQCEWDKKVSLGMG